MFYKLGKRTPQKAENVFVADNAKVIGSVSLEEQSSVWFGVVIRGDNDQITVGPQSNVQDNAVLHTDGGIPLTIGRGVTVGHHAMLHGCTIGDRSEEHTSELQSRPHLVCRLLLEKKKK